MKLNEEWKDSLKSCFDVSWTKPLNDFLKREWQTQKIYPPKDNIFEAFNKTPISSVKVVIIGQDPYHGEGQAHGLCFSVLNGEPPPSLKNIYKEIESDIGGVCDKSGNLTRWAEQGALLMNTILTVRQGLPNSHKGKGWENFTEAVIKTLNKIDKPIVFLLWGANAKSYLPLLDNSSHLVLTAQHPSPLSAYSGFFGCKHFSKANDFLIKHNIKPIKW